MTRLQKLYGVAHPKATNVTFAYWEIIENAAAVQPANPFSTSAVTTLSGDGGGRNPSTLHRPPLWPLEFLLFLKGNTV